VLEIVLDYRVVVCGLSHMLEQEATVAPPAHAGIHPAVATKIQSVDWDRFDGLYKLGSHANVASLMSADTSATPKLKQLGLISANNKGGILHHKPSLWVYVSLSVEENITLDDISGIQIAAFYDKFFHSNVRDRNLQLFLSQHVTLMVVRRVYSATSTRFRKEIVAALTFSRPTDRVPTYLAYVAVSHGRQQLPSLADTKVHNLPVDFGARENLIGYQKQGLCMLLQTVMEHLVFSSLRPETATLAHRNPFPECFLHYNTNNENSGDGWLKSGYLPVYPLVADDVDDNDRDNISVKERYESLVIALSGCIIFKASHDDKDNSTAMYTKFEFGVKDQSSDLPRATLYNDNMWFKDYDSQMSTQFRAKFPSVPMYAMDEDEINAKYSSLDDDQRTMSGLTAIIDMAFARKKYCNLYKIVKGTNKPKSKKKKSNESDDDDGDDNENNESKEETGEDEAVPAIGNDSRMEEKAGEDEEAADNTRVSKRRIEFVSTNTASPAFTDQQYIDYACVQDRTRTLTVVADSLKKCGRELLVSVRVSSFHLPKSMSLEQAYYDDKPLKKKDKLVRCSWSWLQREVLPEVATVLDEQIFGLPVVSGIGLDHTDESVGRRDAKIMASFHGVRSRIAGFQSPPVTHKWVELPLNDFAKIKPTAKGLEGMVGHRSKTNNFIRHVRTLQIKSKPPPLPRSRYQISRIKWIPTDDPEASDKTKWDIGYFQGAYCVPGTSFFSLVSLLDEWVEGQFEPAFVRSVKDQAIAGYHNSRALIPVPPGDAKQQDKPDECLVFFLRPCKYQQKQKSTCLIDAFCSAIVAFGCLSQVKALREDPECQLVSAACKNIWDVFGKLVNKHFTSVGFRLFKQKGSNKSVLDLLAMDDSFVIVASLKASDASDGQHAIALFNGAIYDANHKFALKKTQASLDWCCGGQGITCIGVQRSFIVMPRGYTALPDNIRFVFTTVNSSGCLMRGWVCHTMDMYNKIQFADGEKRSSSKEELSYFNRN
jgi:hypothetical protein